MKKLKKSFHHIKLSEPVFTWHLDIFYGWTSKDYKQWIDDKSLEILENAKWLYVSYEKSNVICMWKYELPLFIHELQHFITQEYQEDRWVKDDETRSYLMEYYTREFLLAINKKNGRRSWIKNTKNKN